MTADRASRAEKVYLRLVSEYQTAILNYIYRLVGDRDMAEDLTQETFVKAYGALDRMELRDESEPRRRAWLYRIAHNTSTDHLRRKGRLKWLSLDAIRDRGGADPEPGLVEREPVRQALAALDDAQREVLYLFTYAGLGSEEVADVLGVTAAAARKRRQRAREAFERAYREIASAGAGADDQAGARDSVA
jgi:RNA polymerase sigma-70 factor (ECF subfamily)